MANYANKTKKRSTKKKSAPKSKSKLVALIKKTMLKTCETKNVPFAHSKLEIYHNSGSPASGRILPTPYELDGPNQQPAQGMSEQQRIGDSIITRGIKVRLLLGQKLDRMNVTFKIVVVRCSTGYAPTTIAQMFDNQTGNIMLDSLNTDRLKVVYNKTIKKNISPQLDVVGGAKELTHFHKFYIKTQRKINYVADIGKDFDKYKHYLYVFSFDAFGTLVTDNLSYVQGYSNLYYKDP